MLIKNKKIELYSNTLPHNVLYCFLKYKSHLSGFRWALIFGLVWITLYMLKMLTTWLHGTTITVP